jgi:hypothetical protein
VSDPSTINQALVRYPTVRVPAGERYRVETDFFDGAAALRHAFARHFASPHAQMPETHQVWNYWYAPPLYTYFRTDPRKVLGASLVHAFMGCLTRWSIRNLGLSGTTSPSLAMYLNGCRQGLHNDTGNGRFAYVFSLTRWDERRFTGGETMIFPPDFYWDSARRNRPSAGAGLYDLVAPRFNQLLVFDDRLVHGVEAVFGTFDPCDSRVVLTGHLSEGGIAVDGPIDQSALAEVVAAWRGEIEDQLSGRFGSVDGFLTARLDVSKEGVVSDAIVLLSEVNPPEVTMSLLEQLRALKFPTAPAPSSVYIPLRFSESESGG